MRSKNFDDYLERVLAEHPDVRREYDALGPRFAAISEMIRARNAAKMTQSELARRMDVKPNVVSRLESAEHSPRIDTLAAAARAMGYEVKIKFVRPRNGRPADRKRAVAIRGRTGARLRRTKYPSA